MRLTTIVVVFVIASMGIGCGGAAAPEASAASASTPKSAANGASTTPSGASDGGATERAFAGSAAEATELMSAAVDTKQGAIGACVRSFRTRKNDPHHRVVVSFGIDQEGKLLGVTSKGKEDAELKACVQEALKGAPFPRSHAGIITVTKTYEEIAQ